MAFTQVSTTNALGIAEFTNVPVGTGYTLETLLETVPDGYQAYVNSDFEVSEGMPPFSIELQPAVGNDLTLTVKVVNGLVSLLPVIGAVFNVYADEAKTMLLSQFTSNASGEFQVPHLVGSSTGRTYYISQVSAPVGYYPSADRTVTVLTGETPAQLVIVNPFLVGFSAKVSDSNYNNVVYSGVDVQISDE